jgi:hypothetical protein
LIFSYNFGSLILGIYIIRYFYTKLVLVKDKFILKLQVKALSPAKTSSKFNGKLPLPDPVNADKSI